MKTNQPTNGIQQSTYALLMRSEEKQRSLFEAVIYGLVVLSAVAAIWQFVQQPITVPLGGAPANQTDVAAHG